MKHECKLGLRAILWSHRDLSALLVRQRLSYPEESADDLFSAVLYGEPDLQVRKRVELVPGLPSSNHMVAEKYVVPCVIVLRTRKVVWGATSPILNWSKLKLRTV